MRRLCKFSRTRPVELELSLHTNWNYNNLKYDIIIFTTECKVLARYFTELSNFTYVGHVQEDYVSLKGHVLLNMKNPEIPVGIIKTIVLINSIPNINYLQHMI